jgi:hypothetical protein
MDTENNVEQPTNEEINVQNNEQEQKQEEQKISLDVMIQEYSTMTREDLVNELQKLLEKEDFEDLRLRVPLIKNAFTSLTPEKKVEENTEAQDTEGTQEKKEDSQDDETEKSFRQLYNTYKEKRQAFLEKEEKQKEDNLKQKQTLLEELKKLLDSEQTLKEIYDAFNAIQEKWKSIGNVPHNEVNNLWENYHFLMDQFYDKVKINKELRDLDMKKNLDLKIELCEKVEELLLNEDVNESFTLLQDYHKQWKEIGAVPSDKNDEIWERFKRASDAINARRKEYYEKRKDEIDENIKKKQDLIDKVSAVISKELKTIGEWNKATTEINELFASWKTIGMVPRKDNELLWTKFKTMIDGFFASRKEIFTNAKQEEEDNYNKKLALCVKAEELAKRTDFDVATKEIKQLQEDWKKIGYVRRALSDKIWTRFRAACDEFFKQKSDNYFSTHQEVIENIKKKEDLLEELKNYAFTENKQENVNTLKDFQKRWFEVGFTPKEDRKRLQKDWDDIINANRDKLQISAEEIANKGLGRNSMPIRNDVEVSSLQRRIKAIENEIEQVENNLGFLAHSKNADILKKDFQEKINKLNKEKKDLIDRIKGNKKEEQQKENPEKKEENMEKTPEQETKQE